MLPNSVDNEMMGSTGKKVLEILCTLVLFGILTAGLWPFHAPKNDVRWLSNKSGLLFGRYGSIVSASALNPRRADSSCSLEIWLEPRRGHSSGTILAFDQPESKVAGFALRQSLSDLVLLSAGQNRSGRAKRVKIYVDDVFSREKPVLVTIISNQSGTTAFTDGVFVRTFGNFKLSSQDLTGRLVIGNSPATTDEWSGQLRGLAVYDRALTAGEVSQHFANWIDDKRSDLAKSEGAVALYLFNEGNGNVVHNQVDPATDLVIPERFFVLHEQFLERPWDEFRPDWNYWKDVGINVAGFVPLGFLLYAYFSLVRRVEHPIAVTIAFGFAVSLTIEVLQAFLPTRDSGMTDLITNTLGTAVGVVTFKHRAVQAVVGWAGLRTEKPNLSVIAGPKVSASQ
ncbi:MAG: VanZ family protein [Candidatus Sulfotelmatobacter sp.]